MGLDALVASLNPGLAQPLPRFSEFENTIYHLSKHTSVDEGQVNAKAAIKAIRKDIEAGVYTGRAIEAFDDIGEHLDRIDNGSDLRYRGMLHAYHDYAQVGLLAGLEAYARRDEQEARELFKESLDVARSVSRRYEEELEHGFDDSLATKAYVEHTLAFASIMLSAVDDETYEPRRPFPIDDVERAVFSYARLRPMPEQARRAIERANNFAQAAWGSGSRAYDPFRRLSELRTRN